MTAPCRHASRCRAGAPRALAGVALLLACAAGTRADPVAPATERLAPYRDSIPGTLARFELVPVPGGRVAIETPDGPRTVVVGPFWIGRTEVTWDEYDVFALRFDLTAAERGAGVDATARPSRPYGAPDRGFGHRGYPAIGMTYAAAEAYCAWLSAKTGTTYRLPTDAEWTRAVEAGLGPEEVTPDRLDSLSWHAGNTAGKSHPVATKRPDALGLHDLLGNAAEWVTGPDGRPVVRGGSWADPPGRVGPRARAAQMSDWNETDPQFPKSHWWLSDAPFVGFRIVRQP
ncbi:MAG: SUMF1/EgtB/PvdO family nonheme iron enzyme [Gemmatimonadetes bacterium]|nr:SUMF1/EgtB/PvdO family nonheme iron enzyme [Gemmatimonadota bacterium]